MRSHLRGERLNSGRTVTVVASPRPLWMNLCQVEQVSFKQWLDRSLKQPWGC
jgi:hypothetical protein